jgi:hypothetical protein
MANENPLKVLMLDVGTDADAGRKVFYAEPAEDSPSDPDASPRDFRTRLKAKLHSLRHACQTSEGRTARVTRSVWHWLHARTHPDETLLSRLRTTQAVELHHPAALDADEVAAAWSLYLAQGRRRHWPWFVASLILAPATALLAVLPGPNLIGYWFAYRAVHHALILHGLGRARRGHVATVLRPTERLDRGGHHEHEHLLALGCDPAAVGEFLRHHGIDPARPPAHASVSAD